MLSLRAQGVDFESVRKQVALGGANPEAPVPEAPSLKKAVVRLRDLLKLGLRDLPAIDDVQASIPILAGGWNAKQILGHLIDSASNNHQRFVRAQIQGELVWPNYEQEPWVETQAYATADWETLVKLWIDYNRHLLWIVLHIPEEKTGITCRIGKEAPMTLAELIDSYAHHMEHHLNQIRADESQS